jgi:hypothetical protein
MQDHLTCEDADKQEEVEEEIIEKRLRFFCAIQGLEAARKYIQQFYV